MFILSKKKTFTSLLSVLMMHLNSKKNIMIKNTLIIALVIVIIYLYYQKQNNLATFTGSDNPQELQEVKKVNKIFADFCRNEIGGSDINEIRTKLNGRTLSEILEENDDYETETDELKRTKGELEDEVISLTNSRKNQIQEKERIITRLTEEKKDLEKKVKSKAKLLDEEQCENNKLAKQIENLEAQVKELQKENTKFKEAIRNTIEILRKCSTKTSLLTCSQEVVQKLNQAQENI